MRYSSTWSVTPAAYFGLPDGSTLVVSSEKGPVSVYSAPFHTKSGRKIGYGTLPQYRSEESALNLNIPMNRVQVRIRDNVFSLEGDFESAQIAYNQTKDDIDNICRALSVQLGTRFRPELILLENEQGDPERVSRAEISEIFKATFFNLNELGEKIGTAMRWSGALNARTNRSMIYFEHALLQKEFAETLESESTIAGMAQALAFLQLYKSISILMGDPGTDRDYQRRAKYIGLASDYWQSHVKPLYTVRCDADVAHYALETPNDDLFRDHFAQAVRVFAEVLNATIAHKGSTDA